MIKEIKEHTFFDDSFQEEITIIDLGACRGEFIDEMNLLYNIKKAILVEANPTNFSQLKKFPNYILYNNAIASKDNNIIEFFEDPNSPYNGSRDFNYFNGIKHSIKTINLETLCKENDIDFIDILKIDIEGAEYDVLENLSDSFFDKIGQITVEFHDFVDPDLKPKTLKIIERMSNLGFSYMSKPIKYMHDSDYYDVLFYRPKNKIGILYICTGKYVSFLNDFLASSNQFLLPLSEKKYFIFTDSEFESQKDSPIHIIHQPKLGYDIATDTSYDSLMRYHIFLKHKELFKDLDYLIFFNANTTFVNHILEENFLPDDKNDGLLSVHHSGHYIMGDKWNGYDENSNSVSFIPLKERNKKYCQGCVIGGKQKDFLNMCKDISEQIDYDLSNNIHPKFWDEPYMNRYLLDKNPLILDPGYSFPDNESVRSLIKDVKIYALQLDKSKLGGHNFLRS
jgi:FkbM family methyltransferase